MPWDRTKRTVIAVGLAGILIELVAIALFTSGRVSRPVGIALIVVGMFVAFVPLFFAARRPKR